MRTGRHVHVPDGSRLGPQAAARPATSAAVFLDRDGVLVEDVHFLRSPSQLRLLPGAAEALRALQDRFYIIGVTNQSGVARGLLTEETLLEVHAELVRLLQSEGASLDALYYCPHLPDAPVPDYRVACDCRKPRPGMLLRAETDWCLDLPRCFIVGDRARDVEAGATVGVRGILLGDGQAVAPGAFDVAPDLAGAARLILSRDQEALHAGTPSRGYR